MLKKVLASISLALIGVLVLLTVITANIKVTHNVNCSTPDSIEVQYSSTKTQLSDNQKQQLINLINNATKESSLTALFGGRVGDIPQLIANTSGTGNTVSRRTLSNPGTNNFYVIYEYNNPQILMDGKHEYKDNNGNKCYYNKLYFSVKKTNDTNEIDVYIVSSENQTSSTVYYERRYVVSADYTEVYEFLVKNHFDI